MNDETTPAPFAPAPPPMFEGTTEKPPEAPLERKKRGRKPKATVTNVTGPSTPSTGSIEATMMPALKKRGRKAGPKPAKKAVAKTRSTNDIATVIDAVSGLKEAEIGLFSQIVAQFDSVPKKSRAKVAASLARMYG